MPKGTNQKFKLYQMGDDSHLYRDATEKVVSLVSQGVKYVKKSLIIKYC